ASRYAGTKAPAQPLTSVVGVASDPAHVAGEGRATRVVVQAHGRSDDLLRRVRRKEPAFRDNPIHVVRQFGLIPRIEVQARHEGEKGLLTAVGKGADGGAGRGIQGGTMMR